MKNELKDMLSERAKDVSERAREVADKARKFREDPMAAARKASAKGAESIKSLNDPIRAFARSGVKLTAISQNTAQSLIELQTEIVTTALSEAATQLERVARTVSVTDMVRDQVGVLKSARERIVTDMERAVKILRSAGGDMRKVATGTFSKAKAKASATRAKRAPAKGKRAVKKRVAKKAK